MSAWEDEEGGRLELAERERAEIEIIEEFLPRPLSDAEVEAWLERRLEPWPELGLARLRDLALEESWT